MSITLLITLYQSLAYFYSGKIDRNSLLGKGVINVCEVTVSI